MTVPQMSSREYDSEDDDERIDFSEEEAPIGTEEEADDGDDVAPVKKRARRKVLCHLSSLVCSLHVPGCGGGCGR